MSQGETFNELIDRAARGDAGARDALFARIASEDAEGAVLVAMARKLLPEGDRARELVESRDLIQSALRSGWLDLTEFRGSTPVEFLSWMRTILRRKLSRVVRKQRPEAQGEPCLPEQRMESEASPVEVAVREEVQGRVRSAIDRLPGDQRAVLELRLDGLSAPEIAKRLGMNPDAVRKRESRAAQRLRDALKEYGRGSR